MAPNDLKAKNKCVKIFVIKNISKNLFKKSLILSSSKLIQSSKQDLKNPEFESYNPEAIIVNYYTSKSRMGGHLDDGEPDQEHPIFSYSIGLSCIFLIGGRTKDESPLAVRLDSGDLCVMAGESRKCFHGVPKIIENSFSLPEKVGLEGFLKNYYEGGIFGNTQNTEIKEEKIGDQKNEIAEKESENLEDLGDENLPVEIQTIFKNSIKQVVTYLKESRINMNFRQVLFDDSQKLQILN